MKTAKLVLTIIALTTLGAVIATAVAHILNLGCS